MPKHEPRVPRYLQGLLDYVQKPERTIIGLHSGTSADGPTAVAVRVSGCQDTTRITLLACQGYEYESPLRERIFDLFARDTSTVDRLAQANMAIGEWFAESAKRIAATAGLRLDQVDLIASSGQVIYQVIEGQRPEHRWLGGEAITSFVDMASAAVIAERTGVTTVSNLRQRDIAAGGLGVPTVTYGDWVLFRHDQRSRAIQNIGGIANPTVIPAGATLDAVFAFDSGPGNMVMDGLVDAITGGRLAYDKDGAMAATGHVHQGLVDELMAHPFIQQAPPKGAARQLFGQHYAAQVLQRGHALGLSDSDILASATALTAESIAFAYQRFVLPRTPIDEVFVAGGGARNATLMKMLQERLAPIPVATTESLGIPVEAREVLAMVALANDTVQGYPGNAPGATGARRRVICGDITPGLDG